MPPVTDEQAFKICRALASVGMDASGLTSDNPFTVTSKRGKEIQAVLQSVAPGLAAELVKEVPESLAYRALIHAEAQGESIDVATLPEPLQREFMLRRAGEMQAARQAEEQRLLQAMEDGADALRKQAQDSGLAPSDDALARAQSAAWRNKWAQGQAALKQAGI